MCVPIERVHKNTAGVLTHVGGSTSDGRPWGLTITEAAAFQEARKYEWFVEVPAGQRTGVFVKTSKDGHKFLTTAPDGVSANNLDSLPNLPNPLQGQEPPFPLNIPGPLTASLMSLDSIAYSDSHKLTALWPSPLLPDGTVREFLQSGTFWQATPRWFYCNATVPFPAVYMVFLNALSLERVESDDFARRSTLEAAGKGWWTHEFVLTKPDGSIDPNLPARLTPIKVVINPGTHAWNTHNFVLSLDAFSANPYCPNNGSGVSFRVRKPAAAAPPPPPPAVTLPNVVGLRLDTAMNTLLGLGLKNIFVFGPAALTSNLNVDSQTPVGGTTVKLTASITLATSLATATTGIKKLVVTNQSNLGNPLDIWLFDLTAGGWSKSKTIAFGDHDDVDLTDGHNFMVAAVDPKLNNCHDGQPDEISCVYSAPQGSFLGDDNGVDFAWQIT